jgi:hypothetical protein
VPFNSIDKPVDLDLKEEVFCRLIEAIVDPNNDLTVE